MTKLAKAISAQRTLADQGQHDKPDIVMLNDIEAKNEKKADWKEIRDHAAGIKNENITEAMKELKGWLESPWNSRTRNDNEPEPKKQKKRKKESTDGTLELAGSSDGTMAPAGSQGTMAPASSQGTMALASSQGTMALAGSQGTTAGSDGILALQQGMGNFMNGFAQMMHMNTKSMMALHDEAKKTFIKENKDAIIQEAADRYVKNHALKPGTKLFDAVVAKFVEKHKDDREMYEAGAKEWLKHHNPHEDKVLIDWIVNEAEDEQEEKMYKAAAALHMDTCDEDEDEKIHDEAVKLHLVEEKQRVHEDAVEQYVDENEEDKEAWEKECKETAMAKFVRDNKQAIFEGAVKAVVEKNDREFQYKCMQAWEDKHGQRLREVIKEDMAFKEIVTENMNL